MDVLAQLSELKSACGFESFESRLKRTKNFPLKACSVEILQVNTGKRCNLSCTHCHVEAGPGRREMMSKKVLAECLEAVKRSPSIHTIDITGGSPEMNPHLEWFITRASKTGRRLIVRSNLAILCETEYSRFVDIYKDNMVEICASLPCYGKENVDKQRGQGVYDKCIKTLKILNRKGYGKPGTSLVINLVYNPGGVDIPGPQDELERDYKESLKKEHGIVFNNLFCITNMPVGRYFDYLSGSGNIRGYMRELVNSYNAQAVARVMCKNTVSVSWDGRLYDCDFNQMLGLSVSGECGNVKYFSIKELDGRDIVVHEHCYGCTAGNGSSCQGSVTTNDDF